MHARMLAALAIAWGTMQGLPAAAGEAVYKCGARSGATYTDRPCVGGAVLGARPAPAASRQRLPPQDRAQRMKRAQLKPAARLECERLDTELKAHAAFARTRGETLTPEEQRPAVQDRLRYLKLRC